MTLELQEHLEHEMDDATKEVWKQLPGMKYQYLISSKGSIMALPSTARSSVRRLRAKREKSGYERIALICSDGTRKAFPVHRLVAAAFIPNPEGLPQVNHKDEVKWHNSVTNLEWCSAKYNSNYGTRKDRIRIKQLNSIHPRAVEQLSLNGELLAVYPSCREVERITGFRRTAIVECLRGRSKVSNGYKWRYAND